MGNTRIATASRRETRKSERRAAIVAVATEMFLEHGYQRTAMSTIAGRLGGSKGTLWNYFPSKEELFAAAIESATSPLQTLMTTVLDLKAPVENVLVSFANKLILRITAPDAVALQRLIISEVENFPEIGRIFYDRAPHRSQMVLSGYLASKIHEGVLRVTDPVDAARTFLEMCMGGIPQRLLWGVEARDERAIALEASRIANNFLFSNSPRMG